eukprot:CAMPEP_0172893866 /NCGR_PEP_ID=MMETSP1075-20121228/149569_1 /TAXON_ID=2916 /ORGANISM="Ceratium fusus, Strain PA161109" /LENGTH=172 /DNA_ID=CAMNT_0013748789 /DNA_START=245 /DNA_END=759 /DNA_ORIENTATION=+
MSPRTGRESAVRGRSSLSDCHSELHLCGGGDMLGDLAHICVGPGKLGGMLLKSTDLGDRFAGGVARMDLGRIHFNNPEWCGEKSAPRAMGAAGLACCRPSLRSSFEAAIGDAGHLSFEVAFGDSGHSVISEFALVNGTRYCTMPPFVPLKALSRQSCCRRRRPSAGQLWPSR